MDAVEAISEDELIDALVERLAPIDPFLNEVTEASKRTCREEVKGLLPMIRAAFAGQAETPTDRQARDRYLAMADAFENLVSVLPPGHRLRSSELAQEAAHHRAAADHIEPRRIRHDGDTKKFCARCAAHYLMPFSSKSLSATEGGAFRAITSLLWELLTGECDVDFERQCRDVVANF